MPNEGIQQDTSLFRLFSDELYRPVMPMRVSVNPAPLNPTKTLNSAIIVVIPSICIASPGVLYLHFGNMLDNGRNYRCIHEKVHVLLLPKRMFLQHIITRLGRGCLQKEVDSCGLDLRSGR